MMTAHPYSAETGGPTVKNPLFGRMGPFWAHLLTKLFICLVLVSSHCSANHSGLAEIFLRLRQKPPVCGAFSPGAWRLCD
jgi:hypothetical protein